MSYQQAIVENNLFVEVSKEDCAKLSDGMFSVRHYAPDEVVTTQGAVADDLYLILEGNVRITTSLKDGQEVVLAQRKKNDFIGEIAILGESVRTANIVCNTSCTIASICKENLFRLLQIMPQITTMIMKTIAQRLHQATDFRSTQAELNQELERLNREILLQKGQLEDTNARLVETLRERDRLNEELKEKNRELYTLAITDKLTCIYNRLYICDMLEKTFLQGNRTNLTAGCIILDIDHFKKFNDTYGHAAGDYVLSETAAVIGQQIRKTDCLGRYGGEEFLIVLPDTPIEGACIVGERVRQGVENACFVHDSHTLKVTVSCGITDSKTGAPRTYEQMLINADEALYRAKTLGRNRIVPFSAQ